MAQIEFAGFDRHKPRRASSEAQAKKEIELQAKRILPVTAGGHAWLNQCLKGIYHD
jgi:hypothetical protein